MDIRYQPGQPIQIDLLATDESLQGYIATLAGRMATIRVTRSLPFGSPLRMQFDDCLLLGEVSGSELDGERAWSGLR